MTESSTGNFSGTQGYAEEAPALLQRYEAGRFEDVHRAILHLVPRDGQVLDIGAGTGRDAAGLAEMGNQVLAVEPTAAMREGGMALHPSALIDWLDDGLPTLSRTLALGRVFDLVMMTAVWMHLDADERRAAMSHVASLVREGGVLSMTLRHGPVPAGRRMFDVSGEETIGLAEAHGLRPLIHLTEDATGAHNRALGVTWTRLTFVKEN